jgi:hypothetical protein
MTAFTMQTPSSLAEEVASAVDRFGRPLYSLFTTYTFSASWFAKELLPLFCGDSVEDELATGLQVICDRQNYRGHSGGPWVKTWPGQELFHPKVTLLVFKEATVLFAGSANLTRQGHGDQIELMGMEIWEHRGLPSAMRPICRRIGGRLAQELLKLPELSSKRFVCSLEDPFENMFGEPQADELTIVSPFYDRAESAEAQDLSFVNVLAERLKPTRITVVAPVLENGQGTSQGKQAVQLPSTFVKRWKEQLVLYGVSPDDHCGRTLHAKVLAIRRGEKVLLLLGSANATHAGMCGQNVEAGWFGRIDRLQFRTWLKNGGLLKSQLDLAKIRCVMSQVPPRRAACPVASAILDEANEVLQLTWKRGDRSAFSLSYEGRGLHVAGNRVTTFRIYNDWYLTVKIDGMKKGWQVPIEVDGEIPGPRTGLTYSTDDPDVLLDSLTGLPNIDDEVGGGVHDGVGEENRDSAAASLGLYDKVRRLSNFIAAAQGALADHSGARALATLALLVRTARAHDPKASGIDDSERSWRYWVRAEVFRALRYAPDGRERRQARQAVLRLLGTRWASAVVRKSFQAIRKELVK